MAPVDRAYERSRYACDDLGDWAAARNLREAYRVLREPSSHGGMLGWQLTVWRMNGAWCAARQPLQFPSHGASVVTRGARISARDGAAVIEAVERAGFWDDAEWNNVQGLDGYTAFFEGWRDGRARCRTAWTPEHSGAARAMFSTFARITPSRLWFWRRVAV
jgi:hypothetical protein